MFDFFPPLLILEVIRNLESVRLSIIRRRAELLLDILLEVLQNPEIITSGAQLATHSSDET